MRVMFDVTDPDERMHTMTERKGRTEAIEAKAVLARDEAFLRTIVQTTLQEVREAEMTDAVGAAKGERTTAVKRDRSAAKSLTPLFDASNPVPLLFSLSHG